ncbi:MAG: hypothetical protein V1777_03740 [Candidatus Micrarchaeota archaeon]
MASFAVHGCGGAKGHSRKEMEVAEKREAKRRRRTNRREDKRAVRNILGAIGKAESNGTITPSEAAQAMLALNQLSIRLHKKSIFTAAQVRAQTAKAQNRNLTNSEIREGIKKWVNFFLNPPVEKGN